MRNLLYVNGGLVTFFHSFTFLISNFCHIYRVKIFKFTVQFPSHVWNYLFVVLALLFIRFLMHLSTQVKHVHFLIKLSNLKSSMTKYAVAVNFAVLFENISTTIEHAFYIIPGYRSTWLISYTANMAQKLEILFNRLLASAIFHGFFK